jgi:uncharacterized protein YxjI
MSEFEAPPRPAHPAAPTGRRGRPAFGFIIAAGLALRFGRQVAFEMAWSRYGLLGILAVVVLGFAVVVSWRIGQRRKAQAQGGEFTTASVAEQIEASGLGPPAFTEDGTLLGASLLVVNQRTKLVEVITEYEVFGTGGVPLAVVRQIGQSKAKQAARIFTSLDQYFTHHFDVVDPAGRMLLRMTRPRKIFRTKLHVYDGADRYLGTIRQVNVFWKIRFEMLAPGGFLVGHLRAENLRAWDFNVYDREERVVASVVKSWEGWARTAFTRADRYAARIHEPLSEPLRQLTLAATLAVDLALKQDPRPTG